MTRSRPPRKVTYFEPVPPRLARNIIIESTFEVGCRFRCTMRINCGELDPARSSGRSSANGTRACPSASTKRKLADWRAGRNAVYQLAALTRGTRLAVADG